METQTWFGCHDKFISAENITILTVSSDDFLLEAAEYVQHVKSYLRRRRVL